MVDNSDTIDPALDNVELALRRARTRERIVEPLEILSDAELDAPIDKNERQPVQAVMPPLVVSGYRIIQEISSGGQGTVFRAIQESTGRLVALKVLPGGPLAGARARLRFDREASILAKLDHPNIVRIIDRCQTTEQSLVLVMDYIDGKRLDVAWLGMPHTGIAREMADLFARVADGVDEAHRLGIVHRDLKPSNILIDHRGVPRVLDFGLARLNGSTTDASITGSGQMVGSLPWASPEQVSVTDLDSLGPTTDVYSLGVMLYQSLTGEPPYQTTGSMRDVITAIQRCEAVLPHTTVRGQARGVDAALGQIVCKALAKDPEGRYATAGALAEDLRRWIAGHRPIAQYAARDRALRRWKWLLTAALFITLIVFVVLVFVPLNDGPKPLPTPTPVQLPRFTNHLGMTFVHIPQGRFQMGSPPNAPGRSEDEGRTGLGTSESYWIGIHEVTRRQYRQVMGTLPAHATTGLPGDAPVDGVTWNEAREFCERLSIRSGEGYRLPSTGEWVRACTDMEIYRDFSGTGLLDDMGWYASNSRGQIRPVGAKKPNAYGLFDMHGNVAEWTSDEYWVKHPSQVQPDTREIRGGSASDPASSCRTAARAYGTTNEPMPDVGFRIIMSPYNNASTQPGSAASAPAP